MSIYLDNAATSFPKPAPVAAAMVRYVQEVGASINRSVYGSAQEAGFVTLSLRERLGRLLGCSSGPTHVILTSGCTMALNMAIQGFLQPGDHCIVSQMEHNAVMRPLHQLGIQVDRIPCDSQGFLQLEALPKLIQPHTRMVILAHGSNVSGAVQDAAAVGKLCQEQGVPFLVDAAQTAGHVPVDFDAFGCSAMAVPAHKGLLGPSGIGALLLSPSFAKALRPIICGGTGSASHTELQPDFLPDKLESGTPNLPGIYGWEAALTWLEQETLEKLRFADEGRMARFLQGLSQISGVRLVGPQAQDRRVSVFSLDFPGQDNAEVGDRLEQDFGILTRCGLHCAPSAHQALGTFPRGTVRFSFGWATTIEEIDAALEAIAACTKNR